MTLPVGIPNILDSHGTFSASQLASSMIAAAPMIVVFILFRRHIVNSVTTTGLGGQWSVAPALGTTPARRRIDDGVRYR